MNRGGQRRHGDPPAWLDETLPIEERRSLLAHAIRIARTVPQQQAEHRPDLDAARSPADPVRETQAQAMAGSLQDAPTGKSDF